VDKKNTMKFITKN